MVEIHPRTAKGSPLTTQEGDQNLINLKESIEALQTLGLNGWTQDPTTLDVTIHLTDGDVGPFKLPRIPMRNRGEWAAGIYQAGDIVTSGNSAYTRESDGDSTDFEDELDAGYWKLLVAGGSGGGGGGGATPTLINVSRGGPITPGLVMSMRAPIAMEMKAANPVVVEVETAPGAGNAFGVVVAVNGTTVGTVPISGTNKLISAPVALQVAAGDKISISIAVTGSAGAAADLGITTIWHPIA